MAGLRKMQLPFFFQGKSGRPLYKRNIPTSLQAVLGRTAFWIRLPRNEADARREAIRLATLHDNIIASLRAVLPDDFDGPAIAEALQVRRHLRRLETPQVTRDMLPSNDDERKLLDGIMSFIDKQIDADTKAEPLLAAVQAVLDGNSASGMPKISGALQAWLKAPSRRSGKALAANSSALYALHVGRLAAHSGDCGIDQITRPMVRDFLATLATDGSNAPGTVWQHYRTINAFLNFCVRQYELPANPATNLDMPVADPRPREERHYKSMNAANAAEFYKRLGSLPGHIPQCIRLIMLCGSRITMQAGMRWSEIDLASGIWTIKADRMKSARSFVIPLSTHAIAILSQRHTTRDASDFVFRANRNGTHLHKSTIERFMRDNASGFVVHGFRSTFLDWVRENMPEDSEAARVSLDHLVGNTVDQSYARSKLLDRRRNLMQAWGSYLAQ